jgi:uncharacterized protein YhfF
MTTPDEDWTTLERFSFGDGPELADELLALVLSGAKTATCWAARDGELTQVGKRMIACDGAGEPRVVLETVSMVQRVFEEVDADFARLEGEGDLSLAFWREAHQDYFGNNGGFDPKMVLWCEVFRVVARL